ncbi:MAG: beta-ketoacyl synthase chain length factor, partial [Rudaea sp.]
MPDIGIEGIGVWSLELPDWPVAQRIFVENSSGHAAPPARPAATVLGPGERRRAPESVLIAVEAAQQACAMAHREARELPHVFTSAYGDLAINDYLCATLAHAPFEVSPTKFHNSVHNAPAGNWAIASGCMRASTAVSASAESFGAGLLEAAVRACAEAEPVLLVAYDIAACGPLRDTIASRSAFASAFVLAPWSPRAVARARL